MANLQNPLVMESKTLWIGDIDQWMDEAYIASLFASSGAVASVKVIRDKTSGLPAGYGFVEFTNHQAAQDVLITYNGKMIPGTNKTFRLNWGVFGGGTKPSGTSNNSTITSSSISSQSLQSMSKGAPGPEHSIYVGELDPSVNDAVLAEFFSRKYKSVIGAKVIVDAVTKQGKGFGFVKFSNADESQAAIREMQGILLRGRAIKTSQAYMKNQAESSASNLNSNINPLAAIANNPFLLSTLGNLAGFGSIGTAGTSGFGTNAVQGYPTYQTGIMGMPMTSMTGVTGGYGAFQTAQTTSMQTTGYGYAGTGYMDPNAYQSIQKGYGTMGMNPSTYTSYFDPSSTQQIPQNQQISYMPYGYQQYNVTSVAPPQFGQTQTISPSVNYLQQQQTQLKYQSTQQQEQTIGYETTQKTYTGETKTDNPVQEVFSDQQSNTETQKQAIEASDYVTQNNQEEKGSQNEMMIEPIIAYNTSFITNNFKYAFINSDKMDLIL